MPNYVARTGNEFLVNSQMLSTQEEPAVARLADGGFVISWTTRDRTQDGSDYSIKAQVYAADGSRIGNEFLVNSQAHSSQLRSTIAGLDNGGFVVAWQTNDAAQDGSFSAIKAQVFNADGDPVGSELLVNTETGQGQYGPSMTALDGGGFVVSWHLTDPDSGSLEIRAQVFNSGGGKVGSELLVNTEVSEDQYRPTISALSNGGFVISWPSNGDLQDGSGFAIKGRIFDATGAPVGTEFLVNDQTASDQDNPAIAGLADGGFVIVWQTQDAGQDGQGSAIKAQVFAADGSKAGDEVLVNTATATHQIEPAVTALDNGGFVVSWTTTDSSQDGSGSAVKAQVFGADGNPVGNEFLVNTTAMNDQSEASIAGLTDGAFVITWKTDDGDRLENFSEIKAQIFQLSDSEVPPLTTILGTNGNDIVRPSRTVPGQPAPGPSGEAIYGLAGHDILDGGGGGGGDWMYGGKGDDIYTVHGSDDRVIETSANDGNDLVLSAISYTLDTFVERLRLSGTDDLDGIGNSLGNTINGNAGENTLRGLSGNDALFGGDGADTLYGGQGIDILDGGDGADWMYGASGNDIYIVDNIGDRAIEDTVEGVNDGGSDLVKASVSFTLGRFIERLTLTGTDNIDGTGNAGGNVLTGNSGDNLLQGLDGNDTLSGGAGDDVLVGGLGADILTGGAGADAFRFDVLQTGVNKDTVKDFEHGVDRIEITRSVFTAFSSDATGALDAAAFTNGTFATTAQQHLIYDQVTGSLFYDADGAGGAGKTLIALFSTTPTIEAGDFFLI